MSKRNRAVVDIDGKEYKFELDRDTVIYLETEVGFKAGLVQDQPVTQSRNLWVGALEKHHKKLSFRARLDLLEKFQEEGGDLTELVEFFAEQYASFLQTIPTDTKKKKKITFE